MTASGRLPRSALIAGVACFGLAALSLRLSAMPHYDAWGWIVWGREIFDPQQSLSTLGGPAWKPLPVIFTAGLSLLGGGAPGAWLVVARAGGLLALVLAFVLGRRLAGTVAGAFAAASLALSQGWLLDLSWGACDPLLVVAVLGAILLQLDGRDEGALLAAFAAALVRPEVWPFFGLLVLWGWRNKTVRRPLAAALALLVPALWLGPDWYSTGNPFTGSHLARSSLEAKQLQDAANPAGMITARIGGLLAAPVWLAAIGGVWLAWRRRQRALLGLAAGAAAWMALVAVMGLAGYAGLGRFALGAAAVVCVLAGTGVGAVVARAREHRAVWAPLAVAAALAVPFLASALGAAAQDAHRGAGGRPVLASLEQAIDRAGGPEKVREWGPPMVNGALQPALAWELGVGIDDVAQKPPDGGFVVFRARPGFYTGTPPLTGAARVRRSPPVRAGAWEIVRMRPERPRPRRLRF